MDRNRRDCWGLKAQTEELYQCGAISDVLSRELMKQVYLRFRKVICSIMGVGLKILETGSLLVVYHIGSEKYIECLN